MKCFNIYITFTVLTLFSPNPIQCAASADASQEPAWFEIQKKDWIFPKQSTEIAELLSQNPTLDINLIGASRQNVFHIACQSPFGSEKILEVLIHNPTLDPNIRDYQGCTGLYRLSEHLTEEKYLLSIITKLFEKHPETDPNIPDNEGITPLNRAFNLLSIPTAPLLAFLIKHGADQTLPDKRGNFPLSKNPWVFLSLNEAEVDKFSVLLPDQYRREFGDVSYTPTKEWLEKSLRGNYHGYMRAIHQLKITSSADPLPHLEINLEDHPKPSDGSDSEE